MNTLLIKNFLKRVPEVHSVILLDKQKIRFFDKYIPERIILITDNTEEWHRLNYQMNKKHYPWGIRFTTIKIANFIQKRAAKIFYNSISLDIKKNKLDTENINELNGNINNINQPSEKNKNLKIDVYQKNILIRYGILGKEEFIDDLKNWTYLKVSSYLHMPNYHLFKNSNEFKEEIVQNYMQAVN